jgi:hypothetical protein
MPIHQANHCRAMAAECQQLALLAQNEHEIAQLTSMSHSWTRIANQTDRYVEFLKEAARKSRK